MITSVTKNQDERKSCEMRKQIPWQRSSSVVEWKWKFLITCIFLLLNMSQALQETTGHVISACFNQTEKFVTASCPPGHMVRITDIFYGRSQQAGCAYTEGDCTMADTEHIPCMGMQSCTINLPTGTLGRRIPLCDQYSTYLQMQYSCVEAASVINICNHGSIEEQTGYIVTPMYPQRYPGSSNCDITITAHPSQRLRLYIVDLELQSSAGVCHDWLYIDGTLGSSSLCGTRSRELVYTTLEMIHYLHLTFISDALVESKGFWLYFEAFPPLPETTTGASTTQISTSFPWPQPDGSSSIQPSLTQQPPDGRYQQDLSNLRQPSHLPIEAIVGGVLGTLLFILILLIILLILKRRKDRGIPNSTSTCYLHNKPATPTRGTPGPYIQNNLYGPDDEFGDMRSYGQSPSSGHISHHTNL